MPIQDKPKVYVESSTISYLTSRPTQNIVIAAKQKLTHDWWNQRGKYELFISETVIEEITKGDLKAAEARLHIIDEFTILPLTETVDILTDALLESQAMPKKAKLDASHIAHAAIHDMNFLITWNQKHIATEKNRKMIEAIIEAFGFRTPRLFTPETHLIYEET